MNYHDLQKTTVVKLREMAKAYPDIEGAIGLHEDQLIDILCQKMGIEKPHKVVAVSDKTRIKGEIRALKKVRDEVIGQHDPKKLREVRHKLHRLRHELHKAAKIAG